MELGRGSEGLLLLVATSLEETPLRGTLRFLCAPTSKSPCEFSESPSSLMSSNASLRCFPFPLPPFPRGGFRSLSSSSSSSFSRSLLSFAAGALARLGAGCVCRGVGPEAGAVNASNWRQESAVGSGAAAEEVLGGKAREGLEVGEDEEEERRTCEKVGWGGAEFATAEEARGGEGALPFVDQRPSLLTRPPRRGGCWEDEAGPDEGGEDEIGAITFSVSSSRSPTKSICTG